MIGRSLAAYLRPTGLTYNSTAAGSPRRSGLVDAVLWVGAVALSEDALAALQSGRVRVEHRSYVLARCHLTGPEQSEVLETVRQVPPHPAANPAFLPMRQRSPRNATPQLR
jgi:hypothetical protein